MSAKEELLKDFELTLYDFWGEKKTKRAFLEAWKDFLDSLKDSGQHIPKKWYSLSKAERERLYRYL